MKEKIIKSCNKKQSILRRRDQSFDLYFYFCHLARKNWSFLLLESKWLFSRSSSSHIFLCSNYLEAIDNQDILQKEEQVFEFFALFFWFLLVQEIRIPSVHICLGKTKLGDVNLLKQWAKIWNADITFERRPRYFVALHVGNLISFAVRTFS